MNQENFESVLNETSELIGANATAADVTYAAQILDNVGGFTLETEESVDEVLWNTDYSVKVLVNWRF